MTSHAQVQVEALVEAVVPTPSVERHWLLRLSSCCGRKRVPPPALCPALCFYASKKLSNIPATVGSYLGQLFASHTSTSQQPTAHTRQRHHHLGQLFASHTSTQDTCQGCCRPSTRSSAVSRPLFPSLTQTFPTLILSLRF